MPDRNDKVWAIVPAAGKGQRMQQPQLKQYIVLADLPIIEHSINALLASKKIDKVLVCVASDDQQWEQLAISSNDAVEHTLGAETRAQSVLNGLMFLDAYAAPTDWVLVHDAARPCLKPASVKNMMVELIGDPVGGILATRSNDTLKHATSENPPAILTTVDRTAIWRAQTPQMFRFGLLLDAVKSALSSGLDITDEASAMEHAGHRVRLIEGDADNLKVTTRSDLALAELLLKRLR